MKPSACAAHLQQHEGLALVFDSYPKMKAAVDAPDLDVTPEPRFERGHGWMYARHIRQAHDGCDFDYPETAFGAPVGKPQIC